jgi:GNAT superfamily N-acetyltransferase
MPMATNLQIDDKLIAKATRLGGHRTKKAAVTQALVEYIMKITFTAATPADIDALIDLMREYYAFDHLDFEEPPAREALRQLISDPGLGRAWLIHADGCLSGYVVLTLGFSLEFKGRDAVVDELYLRPQYRGQGIGRRALQHVEEVCRSLGVQALRLEVERANAGAQAVYRKGGFVEHDRYPLTKWLSR